MMMNLTLRNIAVLLLVSVSPSQAGLIGKRDSQLAIQFDDISNAFPIPAGYQNLNWTNWDVRSPDRSQPSYVKYASPFQYGRVPADTVGRVSRGNGTTSFMFSKLRFGCAAPIPEGGFSPGIPKPCTITITGNCLNGQAKKTTAAYAPKQAIAGMGTKDLAKTIPCQKVKSYTFTAQGNSGHPVDILIDNITASEVVVVE